MNISRIFKRIWYGPPVVQRFEELAAGKAIVEGTAAAGAVEDMIISPLTGSTCVAYHYRATYRAASRTQGVVERVLKDIQVYAPAFALKLEGGTLRVVPAESGTFDKEEHRQLQTGSLAGFSAKEQIITPGARVRAKGTVRKEGDEGFVLSLKTLEIIPEEPMTPAERKKLAKQKKRKKKG